MILELKIKEHIVDTVCELYNLSNSQVLVTIAGSKMDYSRVKRYHIIGEDIISVVVSVKTDDYIDKIAFIRAFAKKMVTLDSEKVMQKYIRCDQTNYIDVVGIKEIVFYLDYTQIITES